MVTPASGPGATARVALRRARGTGAIWAVALLLNATALALFVTALDARPPVAAAMVLPWWVLAAGFFVTEIAVVHFDYRRESHSFSMSELPLVFGLFFAAPQDLVVGTVVGAGAALLLHRRQTGMKLLFNLGHFGLGSCLAVLVFRSVSGDGSAFTPSSWLAVLLATVSASAMSTAAITVAISLSERRMELAKLPEQLALALLATVGSASLGLLGAGFAARNAAAAGLLLVPVGTFFLAYRGYVRQRQERNSLEFLYRCARTLDQAPDLAAGLSDVLRDACRTFRAELAQIALLSQHDGQLALVVTADADAVHASKHVRLEDVSGVLHSALQAYPPQICQLDPPVAGPDGHAVRQAMVGSLRTDAGSLGALIVANQVGSAAGFERRDLRLLETLVTQVSMSLENGRLARMLTETTQRAERERANALVLQRGILPPPPPRLRGATVAVRYQPGAAEVEVGGDWYDFMQLPCGDIGIAIGDVVGHDLEAAARMGQARSALRAYATEGHSPAAVLERLNRLLSQTDPDFIGTCCYLQFSPHDDTATVVSAGHPPPLLISSTGESSAVELAANLPLGVDADTAYDETRLAFTRGETLVLFTDGLVESRTLSLDAGLLRLTQIPRSTATGGLEPLADSLLELVPVGRSDDDVTLLLLRHDGVGAPATERRPERVLAG